MSQGPCDVEQFLVRLSTGLTLSRQLLNLNPIRTTNGGGEGEGEGCHHSQGFSLIFSEIVKLHT